MDLYLPALPALSRDLSASTSAAQLTLTACLVGLGAGQLLSGPLSDRFGRRRPLMIGVSIYAVASLLCAFAPNVSALYALRLLQGLAGATGIVIARAVVRDLYDGREAAHFFALLMLVNGSAPVLAPVIGGQLVRFTSWRGLFVVLAGVGVALALATLALPETLPVQRRHAGRLRGVFAARVPVLRDARFLGYALVCGLGFAALFAYIAASPFVLQDIAGLSPQLFSLVFAANAIGIVVVGQVTGRLVHRVPLHRLLVVGFRPAARRPLWTVTPGRARRAGRSPGCPAPHGPRSRPPRPDSCVRRTARRRRRGRRRLAAAPAARTRRRARRR